MEISSVPICVTSSLRPHSFVPSFHSILAEFISSRKRKKKRRGEGNNRTNLLSEYERDSQTIIIVGRNLKKRFIESQNIFRHSLFSSYFKEGQEMRNVSLSLSPRHIFKRAKIYLFLLQKTKSFLSFFEDLIHF